MAEVLPERGAALAERGLLVLFGILFAWISAGFWTGVMGAGVLLFGRGTSPLMRGLAQRAGAPARPDGAHGDRHADLQRARADRLRRPRGDDRFAGLDRRVGELRRLRPERHLRPRHPRRRARRLEPSSPAASPPTAEGDEPGAARPLPLAPAAASSARPATSPTSAAAGAPPTATSSSSTPTAS